MSTLKLIADAGATKTEWCVIGGKRLKTVITAGISPYFLSGDQIVTLITSELLPKIKGLEIAEIFFYGTGCFSPVNRKVVEKSLKTVFRGSKIQVTHDVYAAARGLCIREKGVACILGTGSSLCYYDGKKIARNSPGMGYALGDEGSGAYLGKKVLQYFVYRTFDEELMARFEATYQTDTNEILENVYKKPLPNRYMASFARFLAENRGHYMVENIIEDGLNDFFFTHLCKYTEAWKYPINFVGGIALGFKDVIKELCSSYNFELGKIMQKPMEGLIEYHK